MGNLGPPSLLSFLSLDFEVFRLESLGELPSTIVVEESTVLLERTTVEDDTRGALYDVSDMAEV